MEKNQIEIKFSHVLHKSELPDKNRLEVSEEINEILKSIKPEVIACNGSVEVIESKKGNFSFKSTCENIHLQEKMNELISRSMPKTLKTSGSD